MRDNENKKRYLNRITEKISNNKIKSEIAFELDAHIDERVQFYEEIGYFEEEAYEKAVEEMGDPDAVGVSLARLHPKGKVITSILSVILLTAMIFLFWFITIWSDGSIGIGLFEFLLLMCFIGMSRSAQKRGNLFLSVFVLLLFFCTFCWYAWIACQGYFGASHLCSPLVLLFFCIITGDFTCLNIFPFVGKLTVAPWLTNTSIAVYVLIFFYLIALCVSTFKLHRPPYSLFDKKAGKALNKTGRALRFFLALLLLVVIICPKPQEKTVSDRKDFKCVIVLQSDTPCAVDNLQPSDVMMADSNYDWSLYIRDWNGKGSTTHMESITVPCGNKVSYVIEKGVLEFDITKPYVYIAFVNAWIGEVSYETLSVWLPDEIEWQKSESVNMISATLDAYNCVDVIIHYNP